MGEFKTPAGNVYDYEYTDSVEIICEYEEPNYEKYKKVIRRFRYSDGETGYIFGYFRWNENQKKWYWGEKPLIISPDEIRDLLEKAKEKGFFTE